ncbi:MAG: hypothetical protein AB8G22_23815 [Saprospiraceae bacterium]
MDWGFWIGNFGNGTQFESSIQYPTSNILFVYLVGKIVVSG